MKQYTAEEAEKMILHYDPNTMEGRKNDRGEYQRQERMYWVGVKKCIERHETHNDWLRSLTAKPSKQATQRERDIYRYACGLLVTLERNIVEEEFMENGEGN